MISNRSNLHPYEIVNHATGVGGSYCISQRIDGAPAFRAYWNPDGWAGSGFVFKERIAAQAVVGLLEQNRALQVEINTIKEPIFSYQEWRTKTGQIAPESREDYLIQEAETYKAGYRSGRIALDAYVQERVDRANLDGAFDVLLQIRSFRKLHPMDNGMADTLEFIGNLYHEYENKRLAANRAKVAPKNSPNSP